MESTGLLSLQKQSFWRLIRPHNPPSKPRFLLGSSRGVPVTSPVVFMKVQGHFWGVSSASHASLLQKQLQNFYGGRVRGGKRGSGKLVWQLLSSLKPPGFYLRCALLVKKGMFSEVAFMYTICDVEKKTSVKMMELYL